MVEKSGNIFGRFTINVFFVAIHFDYVHQVIHHFGLISFGGLSDKQNEKKKKKTRTNLKVREISLYRQCVQNISGQNKVQQPSVKKTQQPASQPTYQPAFLLDGKGEREREMEKRMLFVFLFLCHHQLSMNI